MPSERIEPLNDSRPRCDYGSCTNTAEFYGPLWSSLDHDETYPTYVCPEHTGGLALIRHLGWPVIDQPPGFPIRTERPGQ